MRFFEIQGSRTFEIDLDKIVAFEKSGDCYIVHMKGGLGWQYDTLKEEMSNEKE